MRTIWTAGHSNLTIEAFAELLGAQAIATVADVRRFPGSRRQPHFGGAALAAGLATVGIGYRHFAGLGGRRGKGAVGSPNTAWRVASFNAYADHMATDEFRADLAQLVMLAEAEPVALMCSEGLPWRCHRRLIADALLVRGWTVLDIIGQGPPKPHTLTPFARVAGEILTYPAAAAG